MLAANTGMGRPGPDPDGDTHHPSVRPALRTQPPAGRHRSLSGTPQPTPSAIRAWAKQAGIAVSERGRIPASVADQYEAAARRS
jgi:hypothetical protein